MVASLAVRLTVPPFSKRLPDELPIPAFVAVREMDGELIAVPAGTLATILPFVFIAVNVTAPLKALAELFNVNICADAVLVSFIQTLP